MILTPEQIKLRLKKLGVGADKYLGQHFLIDQSVLDTIYETGQTFLCSCDTIVEVGPGLGVLTEELLNLAGGLVVAVEKDPVFATHLKPFLNVEEELQVVQGDVLQVLDRNEHFPFVSEVKIDKGSVSIVNPLEIKDSALAPCEEHKANPEWVVIANIPYAITSPLLRKLVYRQNPPHDILVLVQKEAAERITAKPGDRNRGLLTVLIEVMAESTIVQNVPPHSFWPAPEVDSSLLHLKLRPQAVVPIQERKQFEKVVIAGFSQKRKQLANSLAGGLGIKTSQSRELLERAGIDPLRRAETLTLKEWQDLARSV
ncbi:MAG TPA: rRNA adenine dimethyltransferase family protein [Patescibacteria group bacterium]